MDANREEHVATGRKMAWLVAVVFLILIGGPGVYRTVTELAKGREGWVPAVELFRVSAPTLAGHLAEFEDRVERDSTLASWSRRGMQSVMLRLFREGNRKTFVGRDGWLFYRPGLDAVTGEAPWRERAVVIARFADQLKGLGVELILVPIPSKAMVYPGQVARGEWPAAEILRDRREFVYALQWHDVTVLDYESGLRVDDLLARREGSEEVQFLKQDTHWSPWALESVAYGIGREMNQRRWFAGTLRDYDRFEFEEVEVSALGDLVEKMDLAAPESFFEEETVTTRGVIDRRTGETVALDDEDSPIVLLGDSFANIYGQESLGYGTGASFAHHLAARMAMPLDVIAINGQGSTGVRRALASRPGSAQMMQDKKKVVIWAIAMRDLFMPEAVAKAEGVIWEEVVFEESALPGDGMPESIVVEARLVLKSGIPDPSKTPYKDALFAAIYAVEQVIEGEYAEREVLVYHWAFRDRKLDAATRLDVGERQRLRLVPLRVKEEVKGIYPSDEAARLDLVPFWAEEARSLE